MPSSHDLVIDYRAFRQKPTALFLDYLSGSGQAGAFLDGGRYGRDDLAARSRASNHGADRYEVLSAALADQQKRRGASEEAVRLARRLAEPGATVVASGQQAGLFGGPLYVAYKAMAAIKVARSVESDSGRPVVPLFWIASDDHDFAEIRSVSVLDDAGRLHTVRYSPRQEPAGQPASRICLDDTIRATIAELREALPPSVHRDEHLAALGEAYAAGTSLSEAFARLLSSLFPGLVVLDPADPALRPLMAPILRRELAESSPSTRLALEATQRLRAAGYHQQVPVREGFFNLFVLEEGARRAVASQDGLVEMRGVGRRLAPSEAASLMDRDPGRWSPSALLRPVVQDFMLPTIAYIGGPAEIAYHAQIGLLYQDFGVRRPALIPRPSLTLVESWAGRTMEAEALALMDLQGELEGLFARWTQETYPGVEATFARTREHLAGDMKSVEETLGALDPTLRAAADSALGRALHPINVLHEKATRVLKKKDQGRAERVRRARDLLFPGGVLQERGLGLIGPVARHGRGLLGEIAERMDPWAPGHQVLYL